MLPETYEVVRGDARAAVLQKMMDARDRVLAELWSQRKPGLPFTTPEQAVTLASIVEKETAVASERPRVAAVYVNRLKIGMKLEADPTVIYGITARPAARAGASAPPSWRRRRPTTPMPITACRRTPIGNPGRAASPR